jgi:predicted HicB family RNase H-like nuclease
VDLPIKKEKKLLIKTTKHVISTIMSMTKSKKNGFKRIWAWVTPETHSKIKMLAAREGKFMEQWVKEAVQKQIKDKEKTIPFVREDP